MRPPPSSPLCPYTTLFRSVDARARCRRELVHRDDRTGPDRDDVAFDAGVLERLGQLRRQLEHRGLVDRKSTRLNSSHLVVSYAVSCVKKTEGAKYWRRREQ